MTQKQTTILWLGIILIVLNLVTNLGQFKSVVFNQASSAPAAPVAPVKTASFQTPANTKVL